MSDASPSQDLSKKGKKGKKNKKNKKKSVQKQEEEVQSEVPVVKKPVEEQQKSVEQVHHDGKQAVQDTNEQGMSKANILSGDIEHKSAAAEEEEEDVRPLRKGEEIHVEDWEKERKYTNPRGIYRMRFLSDIRVFLEANSDGTGGAAIELLERTMIEMEEMKMKYGIMQSSLESRKQKLLTKIPDMKNGLMSVKYLQEKQGKEENIQARFLLSDAVYAQAEVPTRNTVYLWLGANVMMEYTFEEAKETLDKNLQICQEKLERLQNDLDFVKDQLTIAQVNYSRCHNYRVSLRKQIMTNAGKGQS